MSNRYLVNSENAAWRVVDGEVVILNATTTCYYSLNDTGTFVWNLLLNDQATVGTIEQQLATRHGVTPEQVQPDVEAFLSDLKEENLVVAEDVESGSPDHTGGADATPSSTSYEAPQLQKFDTLEQLIISAE